MTAIEQFIAWLSVVLTGLAAWYSVFLLFPEYQESRYRYRLWKIRDGLVARVLDRTLPPSDRLVSGVIETIESTIEYSGRCHLFFWMGAVAIWNRNGRPSPLDIEGGLARLSEAQRKPVQDALSAYASATMQHLFTGSIFGLVMLAVFNLASTAMRTRKAVAESQRRIRAWAKAIWASLWFSLTPSFGRRTLALDQQALALKACLEQ